MSAAILLFDGGLVQGALALGLVSVWHIEPVLSSTSDTQSLVWPHTTVDAAVTLTLWMPATPISVVGIATEAVTFTVWPDLVACTVGSEP